MFVVVSELYHVELAVGLSLKTILIPYVEEAVETTAIHVYIGGVVEYQSIRHVACSIVGAEGGVGDNAGAEGSFGGWLEIRSFGLNGTHEDVA